MEAFSLYLHELFFSFFSQDFLVIALIVKQKAGQSNLVGLKLLLFQPVIYRGQ